MNSSGRTLKMVVNNHSFTKQDVEDIMEWENEGGHPADKLGVPSSIAAPLRPGEVFEVVSSHLSFENEKPYYTIEIKLLDLYQQDR